WFVGSKDHLLPYSHYLRGYALGMRIRVSGSFMSASELRSQMYIARKSTQVSGGVVAAVAGLGSSSEFQSDDIMVGGGAGTFAPGESAGQLLYGSLPAVGGDGRSWVAYSKDHGTPSPTTVTAFAIGMRGCLAGTGKCFASFGAYSG